MPHLDRNGVRLAYSVQGSGPAILLSHGFGLTRRMWQGQAEHLQDRYTVITWDLRGHGESDYPTDADLYSEEHSVADMAALLDHLGIEKAIVGGLSLGGYTSLSFYAAHPERCAALLIIDCGPGYRKDDARAEWNARAEARAAKFERDGLNGVQAAAEHRDATGLAHAARGMLTQSDDRVMRVLPQIAVPSLIIVGENDAPFIGASDYMAKKIPNAVKRVIPGAGHVANLDQPEAFNAALDEFLDRLPR
jgi:pimeloyl-ACP methyl ester carboxylesterase